MRLPFLISVGCLVGCGVQAVPATGGGTAAVGQCPVARVDLISDCPRKVCGLNGIWMGAGVPFRTLHLDGGENEAHLSILRVEDGSGQPLTLKLTGDVLKASTANTASPTSAASVRGASLLLGPRGGSPTYRLTITDVTTEPFWAQCDKLTCGTAAPPLSKQYHFTATRVADGCAVQVCDPALSDNPGTGIAGVAAIFRDDYYDDTSYTVSGTPPVDPTQNSADLFNIACRGTDIYKLYMLRHTRASATSEMARTTLPQRTTLLRALSATYCSRDRNGNPGSHFTRDGIPIELRFNPARSHYAVTRASGYQYDGGTLDALWSTQGDLPALCIGTPRTADIGDILAECDLPVCEPGRNDDYVMTATPNAN